jgi:hypothetical protein
MATFSLTQEEYEALVALARKGTQSEGENLRLDKFLKSIEKQNGIERDAVWVQWQEMDSALPPTTSFPAVWPPEMRRYIELVSRKVAKADVDAVLVAQARNPTSVLVTKDPDATVGWTPVDDFFIT